MDIIIYIFHGYSNIKESKEKLNIGFRVIVTSDGGSKGMDC